ncbi:hypothetical protein GOV10_02630, partial [Candidatus Woesearchaeota archaeon]|nr:hypothetical protein [Candidatus Woesearchaeota archaeon]
MDYDVDIDNPIKQPSGALGENMDNKELLIEKFLENDILASPDEIDALSTEEVEKYLANPLLFEKDTNKTAPKPNNKLPPVEILYSYEKEPKKRVYTDFVAMF